MHGDMLSDVLQEEGIKCALIPWGNGVRSKFGLRLEKYKVYVPYEHHDRAVEILNSVFNETASENVKALLLANKDKWYIASEHTEKIIRQKLKIADGVDTLEYVKDGVEKSHDVQDRGFIYSFSACGFTAKIGDVTLWFVDESFEIIL